MKEAKTFKDIIVTKNYLRWLKIGFIFTLLFSLVSLIINLIVGRVISAIGIDLKIGIMTALGIGGFKVAIVLLVSLIIQYFVAGFLIKYLNNSNARVPKWARK